MTANNEVTLTLGDGRVIDVFDEYQFTIDMLNPGSPFTFTLFYDDDSVSSAFGVIQKNVKCYDTVELRIDGALQYSGIIERRKTKDRRGDGEGEMVLVISGSDLCGIAQKCEADPRLTLTNTTLEDALQSLYEQLGVQVVIGADADEARRVQQTVRSSLNPRTGSRITRRSKRNRLSRAHPLPNERVFQFSDRLARKAGYMIWPAPSGPDTIAMIVDKPRESGPNDFRFWRRMNESRTEVIDGNFEDAEYNIDVSNVATEVVTLAQSARGSDVPAKFVSTVINAALVENPFVADHGLHRTMYLRPSNVNSIEQAIRDADRVHARQNAQLESYECTYVGHSQDEKVFTVNSIAQVTDDVHLVDKQMLIHRVHFKGSRKDGPTTTLTMSPLGSIKVIPEELS